MNDTRRPALAASCLQAEFKIGILLAARSSVGFGKEIPHYKSKGAGTCNRSPDQRLTIPRTVVIRPAHVRLESTARFAVMNVSILRPLRREPDAHATMPDVRIVAHKPSKPVNFQRYGETPIVKVLSDFVSLGQLIGDSNRLTHLHSPASQMSGKL